MSFITVNDIKCHYEKKGTKGKNVVLLHGWGQNTKMMENNRKSVGIQM